VAVALSALAIIVLWPRLKSRIPGPFIALIVTTIVVTVFHIPVETIGTRFGEISAAIPHPVVPHLSLEQATALVGPAFTIALLAAVESLLSAVVADGMIGGQHKSNVELVAQGIANIVAPLFGGIPATGAIARTATNVKNGGRTPVAGIIHALTLLVITLFVGKWASLIPMATLAAILVIVSYHMSEWRGFLGELHSPRSDVVVLVTTFLLTVLVDLTVAISVGMVLAAFLFMRRMSSVSNVSQVTHDLTDDYAAVESDNELLDRRSIPVGVEVFEISGPFFFGAAQAFKDTLGRVSTKPKVLIIRMRHVPAIDSTGMRSLRDVVHRSRGDGTTVLLTEMHSQPLEATRGTPTMDEIGLDNVCPSLDFALARAHDFL
jgi:sulfate permease, SulP family